MKNRVLTGAISLVLMANHAVAFQVDSYMKSPPVTKQTKIAKNLGPDANKIDLVVYKPYPYSKDRYYFCGVGGLVHGVIQPFAILPQSQIDDEYQGDLWDHTPERWSADRHFAIFENRDRVAIVDATKQVILLNNCFAGFSKSPVENRWMAIRLRCFPRRQTQDPDSQDWKETIFFIEPHELEARLDQSTDKHPFGHVPSLQIHGVVVARPVWSKDGKEVAITRQLNGKVLVDVFDPKTRALLRSVELPNIHFEKSQLFSDLVMHTEEREIEARMVRDHILPSIVSLSSSR